MIGASKILTVSYGTFSCTLEGFDEPFNTMKAIAEYFRDLAAEDRYFGAEPPTPDAAMLHRIAEREIQRRVEAKIQDNGVILRAGDADAAAAVEIAPSPTVAAAPAISATGETVADRLSRLRAAQTGISAESAAALAPSVQHVSQAAARDTDSYSEDEHADDALVSVVALGKPAVAMAIQAAPAPQFADDVQDFDIAEDLQADPADFDDLATDADFASDDAFAAAMPVDQSYDTAADEALLADLLPEDEPVSQSDDLPEAIAMADQADDDMLASVGALIADNDHVATDAASAVADLIDDAVIDTPYADDDLPTGAADAIETAVETADLIENTDYAAKFAELDFDGDDQDQDILLASLAALEEQAAADPIEPPAALETAAAEPEISRESNVEVEESPAADKIQRARARVIKIRRVDIATAAAPVQAAPSSLLSPEAEADLQAELAALEAEGHAQPVAPRVIAPRPVRHIAVRPAEPAAPEPETEADLPPPSQADGRKLLESQNEDDAVSRLLAQANVAMDGEDNRRRHAAIAHLKAAVAATEAERQMNALHPGGKPAATDRQDVYRSDLESVVRSKPAEARAAANAERPTPLVLVSEQRIDRPKPAAPTVLPIATAAATAPRVVMPTRPRRITSGTASLSAVQDDDTLLGGSDDFDEDETLAPEEANLFAEGQSFAEFAEKLGAHTLSDLLEASAVYCAQVLGRPQFTRPLVMRQLEVLPDGATHSREDFMRVFGTLMRQGRIAKVKRGQFAVTDRSPLLAEALRSAI